LVEKLTELVVIFYWPERKIVSLWVEAVLKDLNQLRKIKHSNELEGRDQSPTGVVPNK
jgi:hypothetical protein